MTAAEFQKWLDSSKTGEVIVYFTGFLGFDRFTGQVVHFKGDSLFLEDPNIAELAEAAITAFDIGKVHLFQRKLADQKYDYIAMKRSKYARNW